MIMVDTIELATDIADKFHTLADSLLAMAVYASLVVGRDGSTSANGSSREIASGADRTQFLERRRSVDFILIGGQTARCESYHRTPVPVVVASRSMVNSLADNRNAHWWNCTPLEALQRGITKFGRNVLVEAGANFIHELIKVRALDGIYLSITPYLGGEEKINYQSLIDNFSEIKSSEIADTKFIEAKTLK